jgi:hypothetical protein
MDTVELGFKRLKSLGGIDRLPASDPDIARTWLLAHLIAAVLTDELANEIVGFPPWRRTARQPSLWRAWKIARLAILTAILQNLGGDPTASSANSDNASVRLLVDKPYKVPPSDHSNFARMGLCPWTPLRAIALRTQLLERDRFRLTSTWSVNRPLQPKLRAWSIQLEAIML